MKIRRRIWVLVGILVAIAAMAELASERWSRAQDYTRIEDGLLLGGRVSRPPEGTRAVLNLSEVDDPYRVEVYRWQPIADVTPAPSLAWLREQVLFIDTQRHAGLTVFVHCDAGVSRSAMVMAAYVMWHNGWTREQTLAYLRTKRAAVEPSLAFMKLLGEWESTLQQEKGSGAGS